MGDFGDIAKKERKRRVRPELTPTQRALGLLTRREHSRKELTRKLMAKGVDNAAAETAVAKLASEGWQNDTRFAESVVRSRAGNGYGPIHIRAELGMHGLDRDAIAKALDTFEGDWAEQARDLVRRRFGERAFTDQAPADRALKRKAAELLIRRGFAAEHVRAATRSDAWDDA